MTGILLAAALVGGTGLLLGLFLGLADKKFKVEVDEKELAIRDVLPGNNCGGCGYAGCDALAKAIASARLRQAPARWAELLWRRKSAPSWAWRRKQASVWLPL